MRARRVTDRKGAWTYGRRIPAEAAVRALVALLFVLVSIAAQGRSQTPANADQASLKFMVSIEQPRIVSPLPARLTLHLLPTARQPIWLYRRARKLAQEGSTIEVKLEPMTVPPSQEISVPAPASALEGSGFPHPRLVRVNPGDDYEEKVTVGVSPARANGEGGEKEIWGRYSLSVIYRAQYSKAEQMMRDLGVILWQGEVKSNPIEVELSPPSSAAQGSVAGTIAASDGHPLSGALVSLTDQQERTVGQLVTESDGRFSFQHLPFGLYWITARLANTSEDASVLRHVELTPGDPNAGVELMLQRQEIYQAGKILHKPVLFKITDASGIPLDQVALEVTWSNGSVLDSVRGQTSEGGTAPLELLPGRNFVTLKRRGCPKQDERVDVARSSGIDGFKLSLDCSHK